MFPNSRRKARSNGHPSLWPFYALRLLTVWGAILGAGLGAYAALLGFSISFLILMSLLGAGVVVAVGLIPALAIALLHALFIGDPSHPRPSRLNRRTKPPGRQPLLEWGIAGALAGAAVCTGYAFVYFNAFDPSGSLGSRLGAGMVGGTAAGAAAGWLTALGLNLSEPFLRTTRLTARVKRGALLWATSVLGLGIVMSSLAQASLQETLLPAVLLALLGAGVIPQIATTPPVDLARIPPPSAPPPSSRGSAEPQPGPAGGGPIPPVPSPYPMCPEGGRGEGAAAAMPTALPSLGDGPSPHPSGSAAPANSIDSSTRR